jgi:hypothetical protein
MTDNAHQLAETAGELNPKTLAEFKDYTFEGRWVHPNNDGECRNCGAIHPFYTKNCIPTIFPDQWFEDEELATKEGYIKADPSDPLEGFVEYGTNKEAPSRT